MPRFIITPLVRRLLTKKEASQIRLTKYGKALARADEYRGTDNRPVMGDITVRTAGDSFQECQRLYDGN